MPQLTAVLALGRIAHDAVLKASGLRQAHHPFGHGRRHQLGGDVELHDSYHCSRYNTNTGVLTREMFVDVLSGIHRALT